MEKKDFEKSQKLSDQIKIRDDEIINLQKQIVEQKLKLERIHESEIDKLKVRYTPSKTSKIEESCIVYLNGTI